MLKTAIKRNILLTNIYRNANLRYRTMLSTISPRLASQIFYRRAFGKKLNLYKPITLNEKLMWLKLNTYYKNQLITICADKYRVREYITECGCNEILNELINEWDYVDDIDWESLPDKFVIKCNHGSGYNIICDNKQSFDIDNAKKKLRQWMKEDYWKFHAEVNYKYIKKKIICEKYIETADGLLPTDYKVYCFNGNADCVMVCVGREYGHPKYFYFNRDWELMKYSKDSMEIESSFKMEKPNGIEEMFYYADKLATPFPFVRADFYLVDGRTIFGELTFTPSGGLDTGRLKETDITFGRLLKLP